MLERLAKFLTELPGGARDTAALREDPRVAAAALMFHVMDADGVRHEVERERLAQMLSEAYAVSGRKLEHLLRAGEDAEQEAVDLYAFTSVLKRHLDHASAVEFVRIMWEIVFADGELHELEDNVVWRIAELLGVSGRERVELRLRVQKRLSGTDGGTDDR